ncbi:O-fucosyltransferase 2-like isoform X2 [Cucurbita moschata]|uniref:O-fucosyltransferase family protein n=1 Tax=Cucurbita moschata TaxID=3662 RepID=A0A6J1GUC0_CUCMO|nr:O-fucosyltransferase 2-like isoform X2 [Cucurbita moschata]
MASMDDLPISVMGSNFKRNSLVDEPVTDEEGSDSPESRVGISHVRSGSTTPRNRQASPTHSPRLGPSRLGSFDQSSGDVHHASSFSGFKLFGFSSNESLHKLKVDRRVKKRAGIVWYQRTRFKGILILILLVGMFFLVNWVMLLRLQEQDDIIEEHHDNQANSNPELPGNVSSPKISVQGKRKAGRRKWPKGNYGRLLALAAHALAEQGENKPEPKDLWQEPLLASSAWKPCADQRNWESSERNNGYIMVTANGGMNQQRVAVCNAVVLARLLNSTLVVPRFMYSSVWKDVSQFSDIYQEEHFINYMTPDIHIVKELPDNLRSLDLEAIGSVVTDADVVKEAKPSFYLKNILPIINKNKVVHFLGFGNRLAFDPLSFELQRLRCRCNFHALRFVPKIQETGALLLQRLRQQESYPGPLDKHLVGPFAKSTMNGNKARSPKGSRYLSLHLRFEIDMVAHSLCEFGGGEEERKELEAYRAIHFPALSLLQKTTKLPSPAELRSEGLCPLTPEEAVLMLAALGFKRKTKIFVAGSQIYGGSSRLTALTSLYPNLVTKEKLLSTSELQPFMNFSSQLAALDYIGCTAANAFAMTDSGSQLSSLVSGYRIYYGGGRMPTIRPNKRRLASIFSKNNTIEWRIFEIRVRKAVRQTKHVFTRPKGRSVYRYPRCKECMCWTGT